MNVLCGAPRKPHHSFCSRLKDERGFMLAEQLISIIFIGLLCVVVSVGLGAAMNAYANITRQTTADNMLARAMELVSDELSFARSIEGSEKVERQDDDREIVFVSASRLEPVSIVNGDFNRGIQLASNSGYLSLAPPQDGLVPRLVELAYFREIAVLEDSTKVPADSWTFRVEIKSEDASDTRVYAEAFLIVKRIGS
ncbi:hypothetical protein H7313_01410 [Gordonibacter massiliensis]|uniref:Prepilin-type N-terminal cleavage/methylation domain-containing protein n=2 Tax=Gordonibacter massiliensis (ex Traore et al. 2017) TaxID=1841863 RepID=A0A842JFB4_9ACTN|nr:hypothetical protein [Gordonibacter massiliensis (ex Traore et al. 2017)]